MSLELVDILVRRVGALLATLTLGVIFYFVSSGFEVQLFAGHHLVTSGPFTIVRHPNVLRHFPGSNRQPDDLYHLDDANFCLFSTITERTRPS